MAEWHDAIRQKQQGVAVAGKSKEEVKDARAAARLAVTLTRAEARDAWYALIARGKRTLSGKGGV